MLTRAPTYITIHIPILLNKDKWQNNTTRQREFFDMVARRRGFHPTKDPQMWYSVTKKDVLAIRVRIKQ